MNWTVTRMNKFNASQLLDHSAGNVNINLFCIRGKGKFMYCIGCGTGKFKCPKPREVTEEQR